MTNYCPKHRRLSAQQTQQSTQEPPKRSLNEPTQERNNSLQIQEQCCVRNSQSNFQQRGPLIGSCDCSLIRHYTSTQNINNNGNQNNNSDMMEALVLQPATKTIVLKKVQIPSPDADDIIIKVAYAGLCRTDLKIIEGDVSTSEEPFIMGHEICGTVFKVGNAVKSIKIGDNVTVDPDSSCGLCKYCRTAEYHLCPDRTFNTTLGIFRNGGWAQYCKVPEKQVYKLSDKIKLCQGALMEPLSCITHAMSRINPIPVGSRILILGAGISGNLFSCILHHAGHRTVFISELDEGRRNITKGLLKGANMEEFKVLHPNEVKDAVIEDGIDICIDCSGNKEALESGLKFMNSGGKVCIYGVASQGASISISPFEIFLKELSIFGSTINRFSFYRAINLLESMGSRYIHHEKLGIKCYKLSEYQEALDTLKKGVISKAVFKMESGT